MKREQYIPFDKEFLLEQQIAEYTVDKRDVEDFKKLFEILEHYFHYEGFNLIRQLKQNYALFDPDLHPNERTGFIDKSNLSVFKETLIKVLDRSKYSRVEQETL
jgi:hypothetical protein